MSAKLQFYSYKSNYINQFGSALVNRGKTTWDEIWTTFAAATAAAAAKGSTRNANAQRERFPLVPKSTSQSEMIFCCDDQAVSGALTGILRDEGGVRQDTKSSILFVVVVGVVVVIVVFYIVVGAVDICRSCRRIVP